MTMPAPHQSLPPPLFEGSGVRLTRDRIDLLIGSYELRAIDGVEVVRTAATLRVMFGGVVGALTIAALWGGIAGAAQGMLVFGGGMIAERVRWWVLEKYEAAIYVRGARVQVAVGDEASMRRIGAEVAKVMGVRS